MKVVGIDITDKTVSAVELRQLLGVTSVRGAHKTPLEEGAVKEGLIVDFEAVAEAIKTCFKQASPQVLKVTKATGLHFSVAESRVFTHVFSFPRELDNTAIVDAIEIQFPEYFPYENYRAAYDWKVVQKTEQTQSILVAACEKKYVDQYLVLADKLKIKVVGVDIESVSAARAFLPYPRESESHMLIDLGANVTSISIFNQRGLQSTFVMDVGGKRCIDQIATKLSISESEAEKKFHSVDMSDGNEQIDAVVKDIITRQFHPVLQEMQRTMKVHEAAKKFCISSIYLCGGLALMPSIDDYFSDSVSIPVSVGDPRHRIKNLEALVQNRDAIFSGNVIGLALGFADKKFRGTRFNLLNAVAG